jgi:aryl-alcohol dehydrogenase-like predicted oxidoreductase
VTSTIIGASTMAQLKIDIDAFQMEWTSDIEKAVEALHYAQPNPCP